MGTREYLRQQILIILIWLLFWEKGTEQLLWSVAPPEKSPYLNMMQTNAAFHAQKQ